jgi:hypothetical protein
MVDPQPLLSGRLGLARIFLPVRVSKEGMMQARVVASRFFETINARSFERTCDLLNARF